MGAAPRLPRLPQAYRDEDKAFGRETNRKVVSSDLVILFVRSP